MKRKSAFTLIELLVVIAIIAMFQVNFDKTQDMFRAYVRSLQDKMNTQELDWRHVIKCINAFERATEKQMRSSIRR